ARTPTILDDPERWLSEKRPKKGSIVYYVSTLLFLIACTDVLGAAVAGVQTYSAFRASRSSSTLTPPNTAQPATPSPPALSQASTISTTASSTMPSTSVGSTTTV